MAARPRSKTHKHVTVWLPNETISALDAHLARQAAKVPGARASRHSWLAYLVQQALSDAASPALAAHRARLAEAAALYAAEEVPHD